MGEYNNLYIWVEGLGDKRFFERIIKPRFEKKYPRGRVSIRQYSEMKNEVVIGLIKSFREKNDDCIGVADINSAPCVSERKRQKQEEEFENLDKDSIAIVVKKIEGWYLAGLDDDACDRLGISHFCNTNEYGRGKFRELQKQASFRSYKDFMQEILNLFDIETAKRKNKSFRCFIKKYGFLKYARLGKNQAF